MRKITLLTILMLVQLLVRAQSIYVCPDTTHVLDPGEFQVCIHVDENMTDFRGYRVVLSYDDDIMTFVEAQQGEVMDGFGSYWWRVFDEGSDSLHIECMGFGAGVSVDGPGSILTMTFHSEQTGITPLHFKDFTVYNVDGLPMEGLEAHDGAVDIKLPVGLIKPEEEAEMGVFPNPFSETTIIQWYQQKRCQTEILLFNTQGITVSRWTCGIRDVGKQKFQINTSAPKGAYILKICSGQYSKTKKIIVK